jgi:hypothetical protein
MHQDPPQGVTAFFSAVNWEHELLQKLSAGPCTLLHLLLSNKKEKTHFVFCDAATSA